MKVSLWSWGVLALTAMVVSLSSLVLVGLPRFDDFESLAALPQQARVLASDGRVIARVGAERRTVVPLQRFSERTRRAVLAAEDAQFYEHDGVNLRGIVRAGFSNLVAFDTEQGGSSITQQVARNVLLNSQARTLLRKLRETVLAYQLERRLSKDQILELYLNEVYLGAGRFGFEQGAQYYFGVGVEDLTLSEAATLAGLIASPENFSPRRSSSNALRRRTYVLRRMLQEGFVSRDEFDEAMRQPMILSALRRGNQTVPEAAALLAEALRDVTDGGRSGGELLDAGYQVTMTIDARLQKAARESVRRGLDRFLLRHSTLPPHTPQSTSSLGELFDGSPRPFVTYTAAVTRVDDAAGRLELQVGDARAELRLSNEYRYNPGQLRPSEFAQVGARLRVSLTRDAGADLVPARLELAPQAALVAIEVPSRRIVAMVGSYEGEPGSFNRAMLALRQPASSFKPFGFAYAMHTGRYSPGSTIQLRRSRHIGPWGDPRNFRSLRSGLAASNNEMAIELFRELGLIEVVQFAHRLGISSELAALPSLALGGFEVTLLELTNAYATFAAGGLYQPVVALDELRRPDGEVVEVARAPARRVMSDAAAFLTTSMLQSVVERGTAKRAERLGRALAGKTGTNNDATDAWFVGYSPTLVVGVWVGFDDGSPMGKFESGSHTALPIWMDFMRAAHDGQPVAEFSRPASVVDVEIDPRTALLPYPGQQDTVVEQFIVGHEPLDRAEPISLQPPTLSDGGVPPR